VKLSIFNFFKSSPIKKIIINKSNTDRVMILSASLDKKKIISSAINSLIFILKHLAGGYDLYFIPSKNSNNPGFMLEISNCDYEAIINSCNKKEDSTIYEVNLRFKGMNSNRVNEAKKFLMSKFNLKKITNEFFINLALLIHKKCLEFSKKNKYKIFLIPEENSGKKILLLTYY